MSDIMNQMGMEEHENSPLIEASLLKCGANMPPLSRKWPLQVPADAVVDEAMPSRAGTS